jgi:hypothetical protein
LCRAYVVEARLDSTTEVRDARFETNVMLQLEARRPILGRATARQEVAAMNEHTSRRKYERTGVAGYVRIMVDAADGLRMARGQLADLSEGGCAFYSQTRIEPNAVGRIELQIGAMQVWLPIRTRWIRCDARRWLVGCCFDQPTDEKLRAIRSLLWQRRTLETC